MTTSKEEKLDAEDREILLSLLNEYSEKLLTTCREIQTIAERGPFLILFSILHRKREDINLRLLTSDADAFASKLKKVIRIASQAEEHIIVNPIHRIELDLRLTDAESALRRYEIIVGEKKLSLSDYIAVVKPLIKRSP
jgi:hypothetical protein